MVVEECPWARMRQPWDLSGWYLGEEPDVRDFDSKKEEFRGDGGMQVHRPFSEKYILFPFAVLQEGYFSSSRTVRAQMACREPASHGWTRLEKH